MKTAWKVVAVRTGVRNEMNQHLLDQRLEITGQNSAHNWRDRKTSESNQQDHLQGN